MSATYPLFALALLLLAALPAVRALLALLFRGFLLLLVLLAAAEGAGGNGGQARLEASLDRLEQQLARRGSAWVESSEALLATGAQHLRVAVGLNGNRAECERTQTAGGRSVDAQVGRRHLADRSC